jgi:hypothetical protein
VHGVPLSWAPSHGGPMRPKTCRPAGRRQVGRHLPGAVRGGTTPDAGRGFDGILGFAQEPP